MAENLGSIKADIVLKIDGLKQGAKNAQKAVKEMGSSISSEMSNMKKDIGESFNKIGLDADTMKATLLGSSVAIAGSLVALGISAKNTEQQFSKFEAQTGLTGKELNDFKESIKETYLKGYGDDLNEVSDTYQKFQRTLKLTSDETKKLTEGSFILRDLYDYDIQDSLNSLSSLMKNFGIDGGKALDIVTKSAQMSGDRAGDLLDTFSEYSQQFSKLGFSAEQFAGMLVRGLQDGQFNTDQLGDSVKEFGVNLLELAQEDDKNLKDIIGNKKVYNNVIKNLGKDTKNTAGTMGLVNAKLKAEKDLVKRNALGTALYGTLWEELGGDAVLALTEIDGELKNFEGTNKKAGDTLKGNKVTMEQVTRQAVELANAFGDRIAPYLDKALNLASKVINKLLDFVETHPIISTIATVLGVVASALAGLLGIVIMVYPYIQTAITVFTALSGVLGTVVGTIMAVVGAIGAFPIVVGVAIIALVALIIWKWEEIKAFTIMIWNSIIDFFKGLPDTLMELWTSFLDWFSNFMVGFGEKSKSIWNSILEFIKSIPSKLFKFFTKTLPYFIGWVIGSWIKLQIKLHLLIINFFVIQLPNLILKGLNLAKRFFTEFIPKMLYKLGELIIKGQAKMIQFKNMMIAKAKEAITGAYNMLKQLPGKIINIGIQAYSKAKSTGNMIKNGLINTIKTLPSRVSQIVKDAISGVGKLGQKAYSALKSIGKNMWNGFKQGLGIHSPSYIEKAMFAINDAGFNLKKDLTSNFKSLSKLPQINDLSRLVGGGITNNNTANRNTTNINAPLVTISDAGQLDAGLTISGGVYDEVLKKLRSGGF